MSEATYTPGPWRVEEWQYPQTGREHVAVIQNDKDAVAEVYDLWSMDIRANEKAANASLIAAAPELLEATKRAQNWLREYITQLGGDPLDQGMVAMHNELTSAIAKAEGR